MKYSWKTKKGSIGDKIYVISIFAVLIVIAIAFSLMWEATQPILYSLDSNKTKAALEDLQPNDVTNWLDWFVVLTYIGLNLLVCVVLPFFVENNPIFIIAIILFLFIFTVVVATVSNGMVEFVEDSGQSFTLTIFILDRLVLFEILFALLMVIVMFFKSRNEGMYYQ